LENRWGDRPTTRLGVSRWLDSTIAGLPVQELSSDAFLLTVLVGGGVCMEAAERLAESTGSTSSSSPPVVLFNDLSLFVVSPLGVFLDRTIEALAEFRFGDSWEAKSRLVSCSETVFWPRWLEGVVKPNLCGVFRNSGLDE
jgi:hypothetical protein